MLSHCSLFTIFCAGIMKTSSTTVVYFLLLLVIVELCEAGRLSRNATANTNNEQQMVPNDKYGKIYCFI